MGETIHYNLRVTDKSQHVSAEFNNRLIIRSPSLFLYLNHSRTAQGSDPPFFTQECGCNYTRAEQLFAISMRKP